MRKGIQPALEQYLVTAGGGEGAAVVAAAAAASMDKRALRQSEGWSWEKAVISTSQMA